MLALLGALCLPKRSLITATSQKANPQARLIFVTPCFASKTAKRFPISVRFRANRTARWPLRPSFRATSNVTDICVGDPCGIQQNARSVSIFMNYLSESINTVGTASRHFVYPTQVRYSYLNCESSPHQVTSRRNSRPFAWDF